jgi:hypothetical protein
MPVSKLSLGLVFGALLLGSAAGNEPAKQEKKQTDAGAAFEQLKKLAGEWQETTPKDEASKGQTVLVYKVVGGGNAVVETCFPGTKMEMVSVFHQDGDELLVTHYCCAGNQPRLKAVAGAAKGEIAFDFTGGSNLDPAKDLHMHSFRIRVVDADHMHQECDIFVDGKCREKHSFDVVRKK